MRSMSAAQDAGDERKLEALLAAFGAEPVEISQRFSSPGGHEPAELAEELRAMGFEVVVDEEVDGDGFWHVAAFRNGSLSPPTLSVLTTRMVELANLYEARYDSWEWRTTPLLRRQFPDKEIRRGERAVRRCHSTFRLAPGFRRRLAGGLVRVVGVLGGPRGGGIRALLRVARCRARSLVSAPRVIGDEDGLHVRNAWRTINMPWSDVRSLDVRKGGPGNNLFGERRWRHECLAVTCCSKRLGER